MNNFVPIYTNTGGKNIINTLQRKHIIAVLNAKSIIKQSLSHNNLLSTCNKSELQAQKKQKKLNADLIISKPKIMKRPQSPNYNNQPTNSTNKFFISPKFTNQTQYTEVRSLLRNLISIDKKSMTNIINLKKTLKTQMKKEKQTKKLKIFYVSDFIARKEKKGLTITSRPTLDKLLPSAEKFEILHPLTEKKMKIRCLSSNPTKKSLKKENLKKREKEDDALNQNFKKLDEMIKTNIFDNKNDELMDALEILLENKDLSIIKKRIMLYLVKNRILETEHYEKLKKEIKEKFAKNYEEELKIVLEEIESHIFK